MITVLIKSFFNALFRAIIVGVIGLALGIIIRLIGLHFEINELTQGATIGVTFTITALIGSGLIKK